jgi:hypothetical protein
MRNARQADAQMQGKQMLNARQGISAKQGQADAQCKARKMR